MQRIRLYAAALPQDRFLSDQDLCLISPHLTQGRFPGFRILITDDPLAVQSFLQPLTPCLIFWVQQGRWQALQNSCLFTTHYLTAPSPPENVLPLLPHILRPYFQTQQLRHTHVGWDGYSLLTFLLYGKQSLELTLHTYQQIQHMRVLIRQPVTIQAGATYDWFSPFLTPLPRSKWFNNLQLDILLALVYHFTGIPTIPCTFLNNIYPDCTQSWVTIACVDDHWIPLYFDSLRQCLHLVCPGYHVLTTLFKKLITQCPTITVVLSPSISTAPGWCGHQAVLHILQWIYHRRPQLAHYAMLYTIQSFLSPYGAAYITAGMHSDIPITATAPITPAELHQVPRPDSASFSPTALSPQLLFQCTLPDLSPYTTHDPLDPTCYTPELILALQKLPFDYRHYSQLGIMETLSSHIIEHLSPESAHNLETLIQQVTFQTFCPYTKKIYFSQCNHNLVGVICQIYSSVSPNLDLYTVVLNSSCLTPDLCNHSHKHIPSNGIIQVLCSQTVLQLPLMPHHTVPSCCSNVP